tara:strand:- start:71 stop:199 length:129 start_codon:yes stop_codon:yes gene_type:complete
LAKVFEQAEAKLGNLDILVNNDGIGLDEGPIVETNIDIFEGI